MAEGKGPDRAERKGAAEKAPKPSSAQGKAGAPMPPPQRAGAGAPRGAGRRTDGLDPDAKAAGLSLSTASRKPEGGAGAGAGGRGGGARPGDEGPRGAATAKGAQGRAEAKFADTAFKADAPEFVPSSMMQAQAPAADATSKWHRKRRPGAQGEHQGPSQPTYFNYGVTTVAASGLADHDQDSLKELLHTWGLSGTYDFLHLPKEEEGAGCAVINFVDPAFVVLLNICYQQNQIQGSIAPAEAQGRAANQEHWTRYGNVETAHFQVVAPAGITALGFRPSGLPPQRVTLGEVDPDGWAASAGVLPGDQLVAMNGRLIADMTGDELLSARKARPLCLQIMRESSSPEPLVISNPIPSHRAVNAVNSMISPQFREKFRKTKMCVFHLQGRCEAGVSCPFAHHQDELQPVPDLSKTKLCYNFFCKRCSEPLCKFAHGSAELRSGWSPFNSHNMWQGSSGQEGMYYQCVEVMQELQGPDPSGMYHGARGWGESAAYESAGVIPVMGEPHYGQLVDPSTGNTAWVVMAGAAPGGMAFEEPYNVGSYASPAWSESGSCYQASYADTRDTGGWKPTTETSSTTDNAETSSNGSVQVLLRERKTFIESMEMSEQAPRTRAWSEGDLPVLLEAIEEHGR